MAKRASATPEPASDLAALLDPSGADAPGDEVTPIVPFVPPADWAPVTTPAPAAALDIPVDVLLRWYLPLRKMPVQRADGFGGKDLLIPYTVLLVAAVLARGSETRSVHVDLVAQAFPLGVAHACMRTLAALGFVSNDPSSGIVTIIRTPAELP